MREKPEHYLRKSTESHNMQTLYQIILWPNLIHFLGAVSTDYFSLLLAITEQYQDFPSNISLIAVDIDPWFLSSAITILLQTSLSIYMRNTKNTSIFFFTNWNSTWYRWVGKTLDSIASSIISTYDMDKIHNSILKIPWFHTPDSCFSWNRHDTMGNINNSKLATTNLFCIFGGSFFAHPSPDILAKHNIKETASKVNIWGPLYIPKVKGLVGL